ncbi:MAG: elongation factor G [Bacteroidetes bacterium GWA2_40_14]|jgi:elongation factor G|nr:MAG: elongation factor G [Bacteroidetes bacterium GWA2_40_14]HAZ03669.1 elongation factor G [Marinilabiliales bacterium]
MKVYQPNEIKNITLMGSAGSGKTTLAEAMMFEGGLINRRGDVESKNTVSDYHRIEHEQQRSIYSTVMHVEYNNKKLNIIDTPGLDDFVGGVISSLAVTDSAIMVINSAQGAEVGTQILARHAKRLNTAMLIAFNQLDQDKANFEKAFEDMKNLFGTKAVLIQYPINPGLGFNAVVDVLKMKMYKWKPEGGVPEILDIPADEKERAEELHNTLVESAAENDDNLMELFFNEGSLTEDQMREGIRAGIRKRTMFPIFCVSGKKDMGIRRMMEFVGNVAPSPCDMAGVKDTDGKEIKCDPSGKTSLFVFKNTVEEHLGEVLFFKVITGKLTEGMDLINSKKGAKERVSQIFAVAGKNRIKLTEMVAGDIGATVKLKETKTNHTLAEKDFGSTFPAITFPDPKFRTAIKALSEADDEKLGELLNRMHEEDPTLLVEYSKELKQIIVHGQGEFHLNTLKWQLTNIYKLEIEFLNPKIPYRETITKPAQADYRHKKQSGGAGQFGEVHLVIEPFFEGMPTPSSFKIDGKDLVVSLRGTEEHTLPWGGKLVFCNCIVGGSIDARFHPAIMKGIMEKMEEGPLTGSYARDIRVCIYDGKMHPVDSNEISFRLAGRNAFSQAFKKAGAKIMEPIYDVEVLVPGDYMGDVMSDLQGRRAMIAGMSSESGYEKLQARVPLAELNKYSTTLSSLTSGSATYTMKFAEYAAIPGEVQDKLLKAYEAEQKEE